MAGTHTFAIMSAMEYNGAAVIAMVGKDCVGIASDLRLGQQALTVDCNFSKIFKYNDKMLCGYAGLATDVTTLHETMEFKHNMYSLKEERDMKPSTFTGLLTHTLYERRFAPYFCEPVVAGLDGKEGTPYISGMDLVGAPVRTEDFIVSGTCTENCYGMCESLWHKDMDEDELFETLGQSLLAAVDRDAISGWGAVVHILNKKGLTTKYLKSRKD